MKKAIARLEALALLGQQISVAQSKELLTSLSRMFVVTMAASGHSSRDITRLTTKFRDAGRRSAPWKPTSSRVPGRPQDGEDGNRINRWLLPVDHKFYADQRTATLVEAKYFLQAFSMTGAPRLPVDALQTGFNWLVGHPVVPGVYRDPIQLIEIQLHEVVADARLIQSGHLIPLDRGGRHQPDNAFLMLGRSNQLQGNMTLDELIALMRYIVSKHSARP